MTAPLNSFQLISCYLFPYIPPEKTRIMKWVKQRTGKLKSSDQINGETIYTTFEPI